jgi:hypothetical protein
MGRDPHFSHGIFFDPELNVLSRHSHPSSLKAISFAPSIVIMKRNAADGLFAKPSNLLPSIGK